MEERFDIELVALRPRVLSMARHFFRAARLEGDPEDVVQDVLLRLWEARQRGADIRNLEAWAVASTKNSCISAWRKSRKVREDSLPEDIAGSGHPAQGLEQTEAEQRAEKTLAQLPAGTRRLLQLRATGLSLDEIAAVTGRPKGSVKSSISAARKQLMNVLNEE